MHDQPTRVSSAIFRVKVLALRARRHLVDLRTPLRRHSVAPTQRLPIVVAQSITPLWTDSRENEHWYQHGKVANIRIAARALNGILIPAGEVFSFWRHVGPPTTTRGFQPGRMLQEGCLIPSVGGGLCQLTNALYQVALEANCEIVERHAHSRAVPGSATVSGRDATVAWNYIDLRFRPACDVQLSVEVTAHSLVVTLHARQPVAAPSLLEAEPISLGIGDDHACDTCAAHDCHRKSGPPGS